ncbi:SPOR domain-containing protein [Sulfurimonas sp. MAG313]|nr:SPOR domain-containing protein [Sulfurimonas sp. MAG313]MDF1881345.1 SPOR domain-containing protein [Sulfurimonas sp. MAG313]
MEEKNELNDIILNRSSNNGGMKKVMLFVATLAVLLIIVVVIMSSLNSGGIANLPQAIEPPGNIVSQKVEEDPLFEPIAINEEPSKSDSLDDVAKKIKEQSEKEEAVVDFIAGPEDILEEDVTEVVVPAKYEKPIEKKPVRVVAKPSPKKQSKKVVNKPSTKPAAKGNYYVQVGSFGRFAPDKKFLSKITSSGYTYKLHKVGSSTKVLIGPYATDKAARKDLRAIRSKIEPGSFLSRI